MDYSDFFILYCYIETKKSGFDSDCLFQLFSDFVSGTALYYSLCASGIGDGSHSCVFSVLSEQIMHPLTKNYQYDMLIISK